MNTRNEIAANESQHDDYVLALEEGRKFVRVFASCRGACNQGRRLCVTPAQCQLIEEDFAPTRWQWMKLWIVLAILAALAAALAVPFLLPRLQ